MKREFDIEQLLSWRLERAEAEAPSPPRASLLFELARPWWEIWPERFQAYAKQLGTVQVSYGYAMSAQQQGRSGHPVPSLITRDDEEEVETPARVLYMSVRDGRLRLRFQLDPVPRVERRFEVTFVSDGTLTPILLTHAVLTVDNEYRLDAELPPEVATTWEGLKVTDQMPFRFILRAVAE